MELLAPAGNIEKLHYAYQYGADAAYIGVKTFSLRAKADNFHEDEYKRIRVMKGDKKLYCALNIFFHNSDLGRLKDELDYLENYPFDAYIISDIGAAKVVKDRFPDKELHLSTQANCVNVESAKLYQDMGFSRIIPGRELGLGEIEEIKSALPDLEIEVFVHGAMCLAYSGRCFLSAWMADRSANAGDCAHSCRWKYRYLEESERPGELYPVVQGENFTTILSSKDMCLVDHLSDLKNAGVDSLKIEGRMKSLYYTAVVTRGYRKKLDALAGKAVPDLDDYVAELYKVSHREFTTGFYYGTEDVSVPTEKTYVREFMFLGTVLDKVSENTYRLNVKNQIRTDHRLEYIGPDTLFIEDDDFQLLGPDMQPVEKTDHGKEAYLRTDKPLQPGFILRKKKQV